MSGLLNTVKISDVPESKAAKFRGAATIGEVVQNEVANGKVQVAIPLEYQRADGSDAKFTLRVFLKPEWFEDGYEVRDPLKQENPSEERSEAFAYQLNVQKIVRPLFKNLELEDIDFDLLEGKVVGVNLGPEGPSRDPSRLEVKSFYKVK